MGSKQFYIGLLLIQIPIKSQGKYQIGTDTDWGFGLDSTNRNFKGNLGSKQFYIGLLLIQIPIKLQGKYQIGTDTDSGFGLDSTNKNFQGNLGSNRDFEFGPRSLIFMQCFSGILSQSCPFIVETSLVLITVSWIQMDHQSRYNFLSVNP